MLRLCGEAARLRGESADARRRERRRRARLLRQVALEPLVAETAGHRQALDADVVLHEEREHVDGGRVVLRRREQRDVLRHERAARRRVGRRHVVDARVLVGGHGVRVVEAELELVARAERVIDVVVARRVELIAIAMTDRVGREVAVDDAGRVVGRRLLVAAVLVGREEDLVDAPCARRGTGSCRSPSSTRPCADVEPVFFVARRVDDGDRRQCSGAGSACCSAGTSRSR